MNKFEWTFLSGILWIGVGTILTFYFDNISFMGLIFIIFAHFGIVAFFMNRHDHKKYNQKIADYMKKERLEREK